MRPAEWQLMLCAALAPGDSPGAKTMDDSLAPMPQSHRTGFGKLARARQRAYHAVMAQTTCRLEKRATASAPWARPGDPRLHCRRQSARSRELRQHTQGKVRRFGSVPPCLERRYAPVSSSCWTNCSFSGERFVPNWESLRLAFDQLSAADSTGKRPRAFTQTTDRLDGHCRGSLSICSVFSIIDRNVLAELTRSRRHDGRCCDE